MRPTTHTTAHRTRRPLRPDAGLTLVEVMMTLLIFATVLAVINRVFFTTQGLYARTTQRAGMQMNARAGLDLMAMEIRSTGCDPMNLGVGGLVRAATDSIRVQSDHDGDGAITTVEPSEDVTYFYDPATETIYRDPGNGPQALIPNVTACVFSYFDANDQPIGPLPLNSSLRGLVRSVGITFTVQTPQGGTFDATTRIALRNLSG